MKYGLGEWNEEEQEALIEYNNKIMIDGREEDRMMAIVFSGLGLFCSIVALIISIVALVTK